MAKLEAVHDTAQFSLPVDSEYVVANVLIHFSH